MDRPAGPRELPVEDLTRELKALADPTRLEILLMLRFPRAQQDIRVVPRRHRPGDNPTRSVSTAGVRSHLGRLLEMDFVRELDAPQGSSNRKLYGLNRPKLYAVADSVRQLSALYGALPEGVSDATMAHEPVAWPAAKGPHLALVQGAYPGRRYALDATTARDGVWTIGRRADASVSLDYDPFLSRLNTIVRPQRGNAFTIEDTPGSSNGTLVDWEALPPGEARPLEHGAVVGVGRSTLVFRER